MSQNRKYGHTKKKEKKNKGIRDKTSKKTSKIGGGDKKLKKKGKKNDVKEEENKKKGFHDMPHEFISPGRLHLALLNGNQNGFNCQWI